MIIVCWVREHMHREDHWETFETMREAEAFYAWLLTSDETYSASICGVIKSTDYEPYLDTKP